MIGGAVTATLLSVATTNNKDKIVPDAITGAAIATAAEFINYLTWMNESGCLAGFLACFGKGLQLSLFCHILCNGSILILVQLLLRYAIYLTFYKTYVLINYIGQWFFRMLVALPCNLVKLDLCNFITRWKRSWLRGPVPREKEGKTQGNFH